MGTTEYDIIFISTIIDIETLVVCQGLFYIGGTMSLLDDILAHNREYVEDQNTGYVETDTKCSKMPSREMAIVTCMDTRLVNFLEDSMDIGRGEGENRKDCRNCITGPFDGVVHGLLVCIYELGVNEIFIIGHHEWWYGKTTAKDLTEKMLARGIATRKRFIWSEKKWNAGQMDLHTLLKM